MRGATVSEQTKQALDTAIATHVADEYDGDMVTAWVVVTETTSIDMLDAGEGSMVIETRDMQSNYLTDGLLHSALMIGHRGNDD